MTRLTAKEESGDVFLVSDLFCNLSSERKCALGVSGTARLCSILLNFCFIKRKTTSGQADAALWSRPRLTTIPRHDALRPPNAGSKSGAQAMGWLATSVMLGGLASACWLFVRGSGMTSETVRGLSLVSSEAAGFVRFLCSLRTDRLLCENAPRLDVDPLGIDPPHSTTLS